jgi:anion-transporting  ArsA/GET3 family ATPase
MTAAILVTGGGGVGKTTVSAAIAVAAARRGLETLVLTVDPARRLADALGIAELGAEPSKVAEEPLLWAAMLDATSSWEAIARRHADPTVAERLVNNDLFAAATGQFPASQSYAAAEEATRFVKDGRWDLVVVDTPPSAGGIEFFTAPSNMTELIGGRLLRWLTGGKMPGRRFFFDRAARPAIKIADAVLGAGLFERVAQFLMDLRTTYDGIAASSQEIEGVLATAQTLVVTTADPTPMREAIRFFRDLPPNAQHPTSVIFNRSLPVEWVDVRSDSTDPQLSQNLARWSLESARQKRLRSQFSDRYSTEVTTIDWKPTAPTDLDSLEALLTTAGGYSLENLWT